MPFQVIDGGKSESPRRTFDPAKASYAFIVPRFGEAIAGGAETLIGNLAGRLAARGNKVEVLTTCALDNRTWENSFPEGKTTERGVPVRRFKVDPRDLDAWIPRQIKICDGMNLGVEEELLWMKDSVNSSGLYDYIAKNGSSYDAMFFGPYLFGTTFWGSLIHPENSYLIPCLHDESYAYTGVVASMFRQVAGCIFNAGPEMDLARAIYGKINGGEVGMGFVPHPAGYEESLTPYFQDKFPYVLYLGRKETGKNAQLLIDYFIGAKDSGRLPSDTKLVIVGGGSFSDLHRPEALKRNDILDISHVSEVEKHRIVKHASVLCQPSVNESFSIVLMESWLLGKPVVVHASCAVTRAHVVESGGGLYFANQEDFSEVVGEILKDQELGKRLGEWGRKYVGERYTWDAVIERFDRVMGAVS